MTQNLDNHINPLTNLACLVLSSVSRHGAAIANVLGPLAAPTLYIDILLHPVHFSPFFRHQKMNITHGIYRVNRGEI
ncbi:TPA: hypothetical protein ACOEP6_004760 [Enterobacter ludwigii]